MIDSTPYYVDCAAALGQSEEPVIKKNRRHGAELSVERAREIVEGVEQAYKDVWSHTRRERRERDRADERFGDVVPGVRFRGMGGRVVLTWCFLKLVVMTLWLLEGLF